VFAGDLAYNLEDNGGANGNEFQNLVSPIFSTVPLYVVAGNHETMSDDSFSAYKARFAATRALGVNSGNAGDDANRWYSHDDGLVHWINVDTELWSYGSKAQIAAQAAWLAADVAAINRTRTPWVLAQGHKGYWESGKTDWDALGLVEPFKAANVDMFFCGHTHNYQRLRAFADSASSDPSCLVGNTYTDCKGTIGILAGSPGMDQGLGTRNAPKDVLVLNLQAWGYGHLTVVNATHLHWNWFEVATKEGGVPRALAWGVGAQTDEAWVVRSAARAA
jgi:hypothetical protein